MTELDWSSEVAVTLGRRCAAVWPWPPPRVMAFVRNPVLLALGAAPAVADEWNGAYRGLRLVDNGTANPSLRPSPMQRQAQRQVEMAPQYEEAAAKPKRARAKKTSVKKTTRKKASD